MHNSDEFEWKEAKIIKGKIFWSQVPLYYVQMLLQLSFNFVMLSTTIARSNYYTERGSIMMSST